MSSHPPSLPRPDLPSLSPRMSQNIHTHTHTAQKPPRSSQPTAPPTAPLAPSGLMDPVGTGLVAALLSHTTLPYTHSIQHILTRGLKGEGLNELMLPEDLLPPSLPPPHTNTDFSFRLSCLCPEGFFFIFYFSNRQRYLFGEPIPVAGIPRLLLAPGGMYGPM